MASPPRRPVTASELRANIYKLLDAALESGLPIDVERNGRRLRIVPENPPSKLARLKKHPRFVRGDAGELVHNDWLSEWKP